MQAGDRVNWAYTPRGGYGFVQLVAAVVVRLTAKRATVKVARKFNGQWAQEERSVSLGKLTARTKKVSELGE